MSLTVHGFNGFKQQISHLVSLTDARVSSLPLGACEETCLLKTKAGYHSALRNKPLLSAHVSLHFLCCVWLPQYLTIDSRSTSSPRPKESSCLDVFASEFDTDRVFFLLSAPANQSSSSSSLLWLLETPGLVCLVILSVGAGVSAVTFAADVAWLPVREGLLSNEGDRGAFGDSVEVLVSLASLFRKVLSSLVLRPSQSAELRCRAEVGVVGFGFFSGVETLTSSVENLIRKKSLVFSLP